MGGIQGIGGVPEPKPDRNSAPRTRKDTAPQVDGTGQDGVVISSGAQAAARLAQLVEATKTQTDVRVERILEAKQAIEQGDFKNRDVVEEVARRISKFL